MLGRQERDDAIAWHIGPDVRHQMPEVVFLLRADRTVGQEDARAVPTQSMNRVVRVDPRIDAVSARQFGTGWPELRGYDRWLPVEGFDE